MTVLVVDDQIHVVEGIVLGVRWDRLDVSKVFKAYNALEARAVMRDHRVDILLCDIEMPSESGLELLQWVREEKGETKCIFLTAHPEFEYALAAIRLGGFDYIVQPAPFEEIEKAVRLACESIRREREINKFYTYGKALSGEKARMLAGILSAWFLGRQRNLDNIQKMLCEFEVFLEPCAPVYPAVFQICRWPAGKVSWEYDLLLYAFSNILEEVFQHTGQNVLPSPLDQDSFAFLVYPQEAAPLGREAFAERLGILWAVALRAIPAGPLRPPGWRTAWLRSGSCGQTTWPSRNVSFFIPGKKRAIAKLISHVLTFGRVFWLKGIHRRWSRRFKPIWMVWPSASMPGRSINSIRPSA